MRLRTAKQTYDPIINAGKGAYIGQLRNPVSQPIRQKKGKPYCDVFVMNPMNSNEIDRVLVSEEDIERLSEMQETAITCKGEVIVRSRGRQKTLEYFLFQAHARGVTHINGNLLDFRRENIYLENLKNKEELANTIGYWNMSFDGSTRALISLCIRDNPNQGWAELVQKVAELKNCPIEETNVKLKEFLEQDMLGYHEGPFWKNWEGIRK